MVALGEAMAIVVPLSILCKKNFKEVPLGYNEGKSGYNYGNNMFTILH